MRRLSNATAAAAPIRRSTVHRNRSPRSAISAHGSHLGQWKIGSAHCTGSARHRCSPRTRPENQKRPIKSVATCGSIILRALCYRSPDRLGDGAQPNSTRSRNHRRALTECVGRAAPTGHSLHRNFRPKIRFGSETENLSTGGRIFQRLVKASPQGKGKATAGL